MDFFDRQAQALANSRKLIPLFLLSLPCVILAVYLAAWAFYAAGRAVVVFWWGAAAEDHGDASEVPSAFISLWQPALFAWISGVTLAIVASGSAWMIARLSRGGGRWVAEELGGRRVDPATTDAAQRRLLNVVEEMAIASGVPVPDVYVLPGESGLNAFAAGFTPGDAVIGVTAGAVKYLSRDELQGVVAHEFSHILHGDMRLNMRLMGLVHGLFTITVLADAMMLATHPKHDDTLTTPDEAFSLPRLMRDLVVLVVGFVLSFIGWHGAFFGRIIQGAVSRQREFLADAAAVEFTRNPEGLGAALQQARTWPERGTIHSPHAEEAGHILFVNGLADDHFWLTASHPPPEERIRRLQTMMGLAHLPEPQRTQAGIGGAREARATVERRKPLAEEAIPGAALAAAAGHRVTSQDAVASVGIPTDRHLSFAAELIALLPEPLKTAARDPQGAEMVVYLVLLRGEEAVRSQQLRILEARLGKDDFCRFCKLNDQLPPLSDFVRIPLIEMALPALRTIARDTYSRLKETVTALIAADQAMDLFEFALQKMLRRHLAPHFETLARASVRIPELRGVVYDCAALLSALAHAGADTPEQAERAFGRGVKALNAATLDFRFLTRADCSLNVLEIALEHVSESAFDVKRRVLAACAETVAADGLIRPQEAELLRAIADALGCPMPPLAAVKEHVKSA